MLYDFPENIQQYFFEGISMFFETIRMYLIMRN